MKHKHHIIPRHAGGTDEPSNLVELTVKQHAEEHKKLYDLYGKYEDKIAWLGLSSQIGKEDIRLETSRLGGKNNKDKPKTSEHARKVKDANSGKEQKGGVKEHTTATKKIISEAMVGNQNSKNHSSEDYKKKQSEAMKRSWERKRQLLVG